MRPGVLLHVGFHKAGSSWLEQWLGRHPPIRFTAGTFGGHGNPMDLCRQAAREPSLFGRAARGAIEPVADSYRERFRGSATTLAALPRFALYRAAYLLDAEGAA